MTLILHEHPFASWCWKARIAPYERDVPSKSHVVADAADRAPLAERWSMASNPVLVDHSARITLPESTIIIEYRRGSGTGRSTACHLVDAEDRRRQPASGGPQGPGGRHRGARPARSRLRAARTPTWPTEAGLPATPSATPTAPVLFYGPVVHRWDEDSWPT